MFDSWDSTITDWIIDNMLEKESSNDGTREDDKGTVDRDVQDSKEES